MTSITLLESLMNASHDGIFIADVKTGYIVFANDSAHKLLGYQNNELIGKHQTQLHPIEDCNYIAEKFKDFVSNSDYKELETRIIHKTGYFIPVKITSANLFVDDNILYAAAYFKDLRLEKNLQEIAFLQSHVIRKPLANIIGLCNLFENDVYTSQSEITDAVHDILNQAKELDTVIVDVVNFTNNISKK